MKKIFRSHPLHDNDIENIAFDYINKQFIIEITGITKEKTKSLKHILNGLFRAYNMDEHQHFIFDYNTDKSSIEISGNIYNAFKMMCEQRVISEYLESLINKDEEIQCLLTSFKSFPKINYNGSWVVHAPLIETKPQADFVDHPSENKLDEIIKSPRP